MPAPREYEPHATVSDPGSGPAPRDPGSMYILLVALERSCAKLVKQEEKCLPHDR